MSAHKKQGSIDVIQGKESLIAQDLDEIASLIDNCLKRGQPSLVLDLEHVALIDSAGLELILDTLDRCIQRGGSLKLASPNHLCRDVLGITDVGPKIEIYEDSVSAAGSFAR